MKFKIYTAAALLIALAIFTIQNAATIEVKFLFWHFEMRRSLLLLSTLLVGFLLGWITKAYRKQKRIAQ